MIRRHPDIVAAHPRDDLFESFKMFSKLRQVFVAYGRGVEIHSFASHFK